MNEKEVKPMSKEVTHKTAENKLWLDKSGAVLVLRLGEERIVNVMDVHEHIIKEMIDGYYASQFKSALEEREREIQELKKILDRKIKKIEVYGNGHKRDKQTVSKLQSELSTLRAENEELKERLDNICKEVNCVLSHSSLQEQEDKYQFLINAYNKAIDSSQASLKSQPIDVEGFREKFKKECHQYVDYEWNENSFEIIFNWFLPYLSKGTNELAGYLFNGKFYKSEDDLRGKTMTDDNKPAPVYFIK